MINKVMPLVILVVTILIIFLIQILMPRLTRKEIFFGVRVPLEELENERFKKIYRSYVKNNILFTVPYVVVLSLALYYLNRLYVFIHNGGIFVYLGVTFYIYYIANKQVKKLKEESDWFKTKKSAVVIDTNFTKEKGKKALASPWWFIIPIIIIIVNMIITFKVYDKLPDVLPTHWNALGEVDSWTKKSYKSISMLPATQLFMTVIMFFSYKVIGWSKQQISASNPKVSKEQNSIFRYRWSIYAIAMAIFMNLFFTFINLNVLGVIKITNKDMSIASVALVLLAVGGSVFMSISTGQGGSRIRVRGEGVQESNLVDRDDDKYWKLGNSVYVNKDDPSIFIEKRFGIGWTMNFGRIESIIILAVFFVLIILLPILLI